MTSARRWEMNTTPRPLDFRSLTTSNRRAVSEAVRLLVGSSIMTSLASRASARAISTICRWPMDKDSTTASGLTFNPTRANNSAARFRMVCRSSHHPARQGSRPRKTFSATVRFSQRFSS